MKNKKSKHVKNQLDTKESQSKKKNFWLQRLLDLFLFILVFWLVGLWQTRNLIENQELSPDFSLRNLKGDYVQLYDDSSKKTILYFFAPWCKVCAASSTTINSLSQEKYRIFAVALDYENNLEVKAFANEHQLKVPVLLGTRQVQKDYMIQSFPTFYLLDEENKIKSKTVGYTSSVGLELRSF